VGAELPADYKFNKMWGAIRGKKEREKTNDETASDEGPGARQRSASLKKKGKNRRAIQGLPRTTLR